MLLFGKTKDSGVNQPMASCTNHRGVLDLIANVCPRNFGRDAGEFVALRCRVYVMKIQGRGVPIPAAAYTAYAALNDLKAIRATGAAAMLAALLRVLVVPAVDVLAVLLRVLAGPAADALADLFRVLAVPAAGVLALLFRVLASPATDGLLACFAMFPPLYWRSSAAVSTEAFRFPREAPLTRGHRPPPESPE